ncbi:helix-turn-helix domain-containing protein [Nocardiopsis lambiniae]|uniref:Helix-turn-helix transcriptional regulator n=1 Tax=Nocardiopsis lambiniae TaxID=3075539 RepID=A0ABU2MFK2_9ACTN|nr:helix-turn-helix transcriptional regulator [Nocardiopsis sp. DSM 44743]MDT0331344.1 helix-turn-helix transcriptional regulator [Nocardiopsis sp. DSM 44743]
MTEKIMPAWVNFGRELRRMREQRGLTLDSLATATGYGASTISKYERAYRAPKRPFLVEAEGILGGNGDLLRRWEDAKKTESDPDWHRKVVKTEEQASDIKIWSPLIIPGLLQTEGYARCIFRDGRPHDTDEEVEKLVELRTRRLEMLRTMHNPRLLAIIAEPVIRARVGAVDVMREQLRHLLELSASRDMRILVLPADAPYHGGHSGPFRVLTSLQNTPLVEVEHASGSELLSDDRAVTRLQAVFGDLQIWALPPAASHALISEALGELR